MSVWNGHYECTCYHPLFVFNQFGDLERCSLRPGNVHSADGWDGVLKPVVARYQGNVSRIYFRADAGFANPEVYEYLEAEGILQARRRAAENRIELRRRLPRPHPAADRPQDPAHAHRDTHPRGSASDCPGSNRDFKGLYATLQTLSLLPCVLLFPIPCPFNYDGE
jgi:hypothetical protein